MWLKLTIILTWRLSSNRLTAESSACTKSSDWARVLAMKACAFWQAICHLFWRVSIARAWFLSMVCSSRWACCWWCRCLRRLETSSWPSTTGMGELALSINALTLCWRSPASLCRKPPDQLGSVHLILGRLRRLRHRSGRWICCIRDMTCWNYDSYYVPWSVHNMLRRSRPGTNLIKRRVNHWVTKLHSLGA